VSQPDEAKRFRQVGPVKRVLRSVFRNSNVWGFRQPIRIVPKRLGIVDPWPHSHHQPVDGMTSNSSADKREHVGLNLLLGHRDSPTLGADWGRMAKGSSRWQKGVALVAQRVGFVSHKVWG
jgi:hypothetical protein